MYLASRIPASLRSSHESERHPAADTGELAVEGSVCRCQSRPPAHPGGDLDGTQRHGRGPAGGSRQNRRRGISWSMCGGAAGRWWHMAQRVRPESQARRRGCLAACFAAVSGARGTGRAGDHQKREIASVCVPRPELLLGSAVGRCHRLLL